MTLTNDFYPCSSLPEGPLLEPLLIAVAEMKLLCFEGTQRFLFESMQLPVDKCVHHHLLGLYNQRPCYVVDIGVLSRIPNDAQWREVRSLLGHVDDFHFNLAGRATQIIQWDRDHRFCGCCGSPTTLTDGDRSRFCHNCNQLFYPRISPCAIVVITRGEHCLLASNAAWEGKFYSALAGFVEPGETVELALQREVMEEVGIEVDNLRYFGSQPWPFPGQLMLGFHATYKGGDIEVDGKEIAEADWWHYDNLPPCPNPRTLSGKLIQHFVDSCREKKVNNAI